MRGRPPKASELKKLEGTYRKDRVAENELTFNNMEHIPEAPDSLDQSSVELWMACCVSLQAVGLLFPQDLPLLEEYVYSVFMLRESRRQIMNGKIIEEQKNKSGFTYQSINKWVKINLEYSKEALKLGSQFGFSPSSRTKISMGTPSTIDPLDAYQ